MATVTTTTYAAAADLTVTSWGTGLAADQWGFSTLVDNQTNKYMDVLVGGILEVGATTPAAGDTMDIYTYAMYDEGVTNALTGGIDNLLPGTDAEETEGTDFQKENLILLAVVSAEANVGYRWGPVSVAAAYGGVLPVKWGLVLHNNGGATMATGSIASYVGITYTST